MRDYIGMAEDIYGPSVQHLKSKTFRHKIHYIELIIVPNVPKGILYRYNKVTLWCDLMQINGIGLPNTISQHIMFATGSMIKNLKLNNVEDWIKQVNDINLQRGFKTNCKHADR